MLSGQAGSPEERPPPLGMSLLPEPPCAQRMGECADAECWSCALSGDPSDLCIAQQTVTVDTSNATSGGSRDQVKQKVRGLGTRQRMADNLRREQKPEWKESRQGVLKTF